MSGGEGGGKGDQRGPPPTAKAQAPIDLTGYWVSLVTEDWLYRMVTPGKDAQGNADVVRRAGYTGGPCGGKCVGPGEGRSGGPAVQGVWGRWIDACSGSAPHRLAGRQHSKRIQTDAVRELSLMRFTGDVSGAPSLQGFSKATWDGLAGRGRGTFGVPAGAATGRWEREAGGRAAPVVIRPGAMKVVTTNLTGGYLRKNGVPYSANTVLTEFYDILHEPNGDQYLIVTTVVEDPANLAQPFAPARISSGKPTARNSSRRHVRHGSCLTPSSLN